MNIEDARAAKIADLRKQCSEKICGLFSCASLAGGALYPAEKIDQQNIRDAAICGGPIWVLIDGVWQLANHTVEQARAVHQNFQARKTGMQEIFAIRVNEVNVATSQDDLDAIEF